MAGSSQTSSSYEVDFKYFINLILNEEGDEADAQIAESFGYEFIRRFETAEFRVYFPPRDMCGGVSYFDSLFEGVDNSRYTLILLTPGFVQDQGWNRYCQQVAQFSLMASEVNRFIPIAVGLEKSQIPKEFRKANIKVWHFPDANWMTYEAGWGNIQRHVFKNDPRLPSSPVNRPIEPSWRVLNDQVLNLLTDNLGHEWQSLAINLGVQYARLEQCKESYPTNVHMQIFKTLWTWRQYHEGDESQKTDALLQALSKARRNDLADLVKDEVEKQQSLQQQQEQQQQHIQEPPTGMGQHEGHDPVQEIDRRGTTSFVSPTSSADQPDAANAANGADAAQAEGDDTRNGDNYMRTPSPVQDLVDSQIESGGALDEENNELTTNGRMAGSQGRGDITEASGAAGQNEGSETSATEPPAGKNNAENNNVSGASDHIRVDEEETCLMKPQSSSYDEVSEKHSIRDGSTVTPSSGENASKSGDEVAVTSSILDEHDPAVNFSTYSDAASAPQNSVSGSSVPTTAIESVTSSTVSGEGLAHNNGERMDSGIGSDLATEQECSNVTQLENTHTSANATYNSAGTRNIPVVAVAPYSHVPCGDSVEETEQTEVKQIVNHTDRRSDGTESEAMATQEGEVSSTGESAAQSTDQGAAATAVFGNCEPALISNSENVTEKTVGYTSQGSFEDRETDYNSSLKSRIAKNGDENAHGSNDVPQNWARTSMITGVAITCSVLAIVAIRKIVLKK